MATINEAKRATINEIPKGFNILPSIPERKNNGKNATIIITVAFKIDALISFDAVATVAGDVEPAVQSDRAGGAIAGQGRFPGDVLRLAPGDGQILCLGYPQSARTAKLGPILGAGGHRDSGDRTKNEDVMQALHEHCRAFPSHNETMNTNVAGRMGPDRLVRSS